MKSAARLLSIALISGAASGCLTIGHPGGFGPYGAIFTYAKFGTSAGDGNVSSVKPPREGEACASRLNTILFGSYAWGEGTVAQAARKANITKIASVHKEALGVLTLYNRLCTVVRGSDDPAPDPGGGTAPTVSGFEDTVVLKDGTTFANCKAAITADSVVVITSDGRTLVFQKALVASVKKR